MKLLVNCGRGWGKERDQQPQSFRVIRAEGRLWDGELEIEAMTRTERCQTVAARRKRLAMNDEGVDVVVKG
jgi:hypothetical protein